MKLIIAVFLLSALLLFGCTGESSSLPKTDKLVEVRSGSMKTSTATVSAITDGSAIRLKISSPSLANIEIQNFSFGAETCNATQDEVLLNAVRGEKKNYCSVNSCSLTGLKYGKTGVLEANATCTNEFGNRGKMYILYLNVTAKIPEENYASLLDFRDADDITGFRKARYGIVMVKS